MSGRLVGLLAVALLSGCLTRGSVDEAAPKVREKLPATARTFVACDEKPGAKALWERRSRAVVAMLTDALVQRGVAIAPDKESADVVVHLSIAYWEYNDAGFLGFGDRDDVAVKAVVLDSKTSRAVARATIRMESDKRIFGKWVARVWKSGVPGEEEEPWWKLGN